MRHHYVVVAGIVVVGTNQSLNVACQIAREHASKDDHVVIYSQGIATDEDGCDRVYRHVYGVCVGDKMILVK